MPIQQAFQKTQEQESGSNPLNQLILFDS